MRTHKNLIDAVANSLKDIFTPTPRHTVAENYSITSTASSISEGGLHSTKGILIGFQPDKYLKFLFQKNRKWGSRDRKIVAELIYEIIRWWRLYWFCLDKEVNLELKDIYLLIGVHFILTDNQLPDYQEFNGIDKDSVLKRRKEAEAIRAVRESVPDWIDELCAERVDNWDLEIKSMNKTADVVLRVNTLLINKTELRQILSDEGYETIELPDSDETLILQERKNVFQTQAFKSGYFEVQDASSQKVGMFLDVVQGLRVIDACAGAGGKSLHIAALMKNKGRVLALDINEKKLGILKERAKRNKIDIIETRLITSRKVIKRLKETADRVLLDVPCSGLGVIKRNPDTKWKLTEEELSHLIKLQAELLSEYSAMVKPGGQLVYSTCSILPDENQIQIKKFLEYNPFFRLTEELVLSPSATGFDGFYMAKLHRNP